jgi:predicted nucleotidyltransferase
MVNMVGGDIDYPAYETVRGRRIAARRAAAVAALTQVESLAREAGGSLLVFGSLAEGGFHERSDIDVAVMGLAAPEDEAIATAVDTSLALAGFVADVVPERFLPPSLLTRVKLRGKAPSALG